LEEEVLEEPEEEVIINMKGKQIRLWRLRRISLPLENIRLLF
jgi:hypothetical protein